MEKSQVMNQAVNPFSAAEVDLGNGEFKYFVRHCHQVDQIYGQMEKKSACRSQRDANAPQRADIHNIGKTGVPPAAE